MKNLSYIGKEGSENVSQHVGIGLTDVLGYIDICWLRHKGLRFYIYLIDECEI